MIGRLLVICAALLVALSSRSFMPEPASSQEVHLATLDVKEVANGYRANALKLKPVINDKRETIGRIDDFVFGKDGSIFVVLAVGDLTGLDNHLVAVPFRSLKLDDKRVVVLPGASPEALQKLPVFLYGQQ